MKISAFYIIGFIFFSCNSNQSSSDLHSEDPKEIRFYTTDSIQIIGDLYTRDKDGSSLLLFHQGGSNARAEYGPIIPGLQEYDFNILAIDQRVGGQIYGSYNRTLAQVHDHSFDNPYGYCDAYNNLEGALDYLINLGFTGQKIIWGSSYSAALAIQLANKRSEDVSGVLAFSPASGRAMEDCLADEYLYNLKVPLLLLRPPNEMQSESVIQQFNLADSLNHQTYAAEHGVHGSSMLVDERVDGPTEENWKVVRSFLNQFME